MLFRSLAVSLVLSLTLSPALASFILRGGAEHDTRFIAAIKRPYLRLLDLALANERKTIASAIALFIATLGVVPFLGTAFIPEMKEGSISPSMDRVPNISIDESIRMEMEAMRLVLEVPGVSRAVSRLGRGESPADPAGPNEADPIVSLKPRSEWPRGWTQDTIAAAIQEKLRAIPGVQLVMAQPISDRVDEMVTGVRSDVAIKIFGDNMDQLRDKANEIARIAATVPGMRDLRVERVTGQQYLSIEIDRRAIARQGLNVADVHDVIETAIGGIARIALRHDDEVGVELVLHVDRGAVPRDGLVERHDLDARAHGATLALNRLIVDAHARQAGGDALAHQPAHRHHTAMPGIAVQDHRHVDGACNPAADGDALRHGRRADVDQPGIGAHDARGADEQALAARLLHDLAVKGGGRVHDHQHLALPLQIRLQSRTLLCRRVQN